jgi:ribosome-binding protein aMBF1 (putative translation factor)
VNERDWQLEADPLDAECVLASAILKARKDGAPSQEPVATTMGRTQAIVAHLESGRVAAPTRTLERFARVTYTKLRSPTYPGRRPAIMAIMGWYQPSKSQT